MHLMIFLNIFGLSNKGENMSSVTDLARDFFSSNIFFLTLSMSESVHCSVTKLLVGHAADLGVVLL